MIRKFQALLLLLSILFSASTFAADGYGQVLFDIARGDNGGVPLNERRLGCLISKRTEDMWSGEQIGAEYPFAKGYIEMSGNKDGCLRLCANYNKSIVTNKYGRNVDFEFKDLLNRGGTNYECRTYYSPFYKEPARCNANVDHCNLQAYQHPLPPPPTCSMSLNTTVGLPTTDFYIANWSSTSAYACELSDETGAIVPIACSGANGLLGKRTVGKHTSIFRVLGFGYDTQCSQNYTVYNPVTISCSATPFTLSLKANTVLSSSWSTKGDVSKCELYLGSTYIKDIACSGSSNDPVRNLFSTTGYKVFNIRAYQKGGGYKRCVRTVEVVN